MRSQISSKVFYSNPDGIVAKAVQKADDVLFELESLEKLTGYEREELVDFVAALMLKERGYNQELLSYALLGNAPEGMTPEQLDEAMSTTTQGVA